MPTSNDSLILNFVFTIPGCLLNSIKLVNFSQTKGVFEID